MARLRLGDDTVTLPIGTRVVLRVDVAGREGFVHRQASIATVEDVHKNTYTLTTPSGRTLTAQRDQIAVQRKDLLADLGARQATFQDLAHHVVYAAVVGSQAWGLAGPDSDEDVRGAFVLPFDRYTSLWEAPDEILDPSRDAAYWEIEKLLHQGLRGDANTLECLWAPRVKVATPIGQRLRDEREMFVSMNVLGSFGRYAQSQFKKIERSLERNAALAHLIEGIDQRGVDDVDAAMRDLATLISDEKARRREITSMVRSIFDRGLVDRADFSVLVEAVRAGRRAELEPGPHRPKNAYNLLRLLHSCLSWLRFGAPLIEVEGDLRETLLAIKEQRTPIERTLALAQGVAAEIDEAAHLATLPLAPNYDAADRLLRDARREVARATFVSEWRASDLFATPSSVALPASLDADAVPFLYDAVQAQDFRGTMWLALSGSHAFGFATPRSDVDVKGTFVADPWDALGFAEVSPAVDFVGTFHGKKYDLTVNELEMTARSILAGNGNFIERFLGPFPLFTTRAGEAFAVRVESALSRRVHDHYRGFTVGIIRRYQSEAEANKRLVKRLLYAYRATLTGVHLLTTGQVVTNVTELAATYGFERVPELVALRVEQGRETLTEWEAAAYVADFEALERALAEALATSVLPPTPTREATAALESFVVGMRSL